MVYHVLIYLSCPDIWAARFVTVETPDVFRKQLSCNGLLYEDFLLAKFVLN